MDKKSRFCYIILNKPYGVLSQFSDLQGRETLSLLGKFPKDVYPVGRLDFDSEGLILLTNDNKLKHYLLEPKYQHPRTYLVQVEGIPSGDDLVKLRRGVLIENKLTLPAIVNLLKNEPNIFSRSKPIRIRKNIPTAWLEITIHEGRNRQVRKMTAAIGHPTLRLIRLKIGTLSLNGLNPGESRALTPKEILRLKKYFTDEKLSRGG